jgi:ERCC4-type nuclease
MRIGVVIDTREKRPWSFPDEYVETRIGKLNAGDYALDGDNAFAIERKSLDDFLGTISTGWERFLREIGRMEGARFQRKVIIVEGDFESTCFRESTTGEMVSPQHNHPRLSPQFVTKRIAELTMMGVAVIFAGRPEYAAAIAYRILWERHLELGNAACSC